MNKYSIATCLTHQPASQYCVTMHYTPQPAPPPKPINTYATSMPPHPKRFISETDTILVFASPTQRPKLSKNQFPSPNQPLHLYQKDFSTKPSITFHLHKFYLQPPHNAPLKLYTTTYPFPSSTSNTTSPKEPH